MLPAVGAALVWLPAAIYLLAAGRVWQGVLLIGYGVLVIGLVDNFVRPVLVGKDTQMPDYVVLVSTLGGIAVFAVQWLFDRASDRGDVHRCLGDLFFVETGSEFRRPLTPSSA